MDILCSKSLVTFSKVSSDFSQRVYILQVVYSGKELNHPFGLSHHGNYVFWTDYMNGSIFQLDLVTNEVTLLRRERPPLFGLQIYDPRKQQGIKNYIKILLTSTYGNTSQCLQNLCFCLCCWSFMKKSVQLLQSKSNLRLCYHNFLLFIVQNSPSE